MGVLCEVETFKDALVKCHELLEDDKLKNRGVEVSESIEKLRGFLKSLIDCAAEAESYEQLLTLFQRIEISFNHLKFVGFAGKLLDAVQIIKPSTARHRSVLKSIPKPLSRTGHDFLWSELKDAQRLGYEEEIVKATATFQLLEVAVLAHTKEERNPISTLRRSMGDRLPEEYFAELLAGWTAEDVLKINLENKGFDCDLIGADKERNILFVRPADMGDYDLKVSRRSERYFLEVQRVGKLSKVRRGNRIGKVKTTLKSHKYKGGSDPSKVLVLWIGKTPSQISQQYRRWFGKIIFIPDVKNNPDIEFEDDQIFLPSSLLDYSPYWENFKNLPQEDVVNFLKV